MDKTDYFTFLQIILQRMLNDMEKFTWQLTKAGQGRAGQRLYALGFVVSSTYIPGLGQTLSNVWP